MNRTQDTSTRLAERGLDFAGVSIAIPAHNKSHLTMQTLDSLAKMRVPPGIQVECVVVANNCSDDTESVVCERAKSMPFPTRVVAEPKPGVSHARNRGVQESRHDLVLMVDNDVLVAESLLEEHLRVYAENDADVVSGRIDLWWAEVERPDWLTNDMLIMLGQNTRAEEVFQMSRPDVFGANMSFRKGVIERVGGFSAGLGRMGKIRLAGEETMMARRAMAHGFKVFFTHRAVVQHYVPASSLETEFFARNSRAGAITLLIMAERVTPMLAAKTIVAGVGRICAGIVNLGLSHLPGSAERTIRLRRTGRILLATGRGQLEGLWHRVVKGPAHA